MEIIYGNTSTYIYEMEQDQLEELIKKTNRSRGQTLFLFQLVDGDFEKLKDLESKIKNSLYICCPGDKDEVDKILSTKCENKWFNL